MSGPLHPALSALAAGERPDGSALDTAFAALLDGQATPAQTGAFLLGLERVGVDAATLASGASAMRARMTPTPWDGPCVDVCGTGGDGAHTLNVSTAVAFALAGCGLTVAKHGNRAMSSSSGAADVLEALGVRLDIGPDTEARALDRAGIAFLFAQKHHPAMAHVAPARRELGFRTVFNRLGPLSNPAGARRQMIGVYAPALLEPMAGALARLGAEAGLVLHGAGGLDEAAPEGETATVRVSRGGLIPGRVTPMDAGLSPAPLAGLAGGDAATNAAALDALLRGAAGPYRVAVVLNGALALSTFEDLPLPDARARIEEALDSGRALAALRSLVAVTEEAA